MFSLISFVTKYDEVSYLDTLSVSLLAANHSKILSSSLLASVVLEISDYYC